MKSLGRLILTGSGLGLLLTATPTFATVVDSLAPSHGSITATPDGVTFTENYTGGPSAVTQSNSLLAGGPLTSPGESEASFAPSRSSSDGLNTDCSLLKAGQSCSLEIGSLPFPIILTYLGLGTDGNAGSGKSALLGIGGTGTEGAWTDDVAGLFINENSGHTSLKFVSPGFTVTPTDAAPEPRSISVVAFATLLIGIVVMKRRRAAEPRA